MTTKAMEPRPRLIRLRMIRETKGDEAVVKAILRAIHKAKTMEGAFELLGISRSSFYRLVGELRAWDRIDVLVKQLGLRERKGRARGPLKEDEA